MGWCSREGLAGHAVASHAAAVNGLSGARRGRAGDVGGGPGAGQVLGEGSGMPPARVERPGRQGIQEGARWRLQFG